MRDLRDFLESGVRGFEHSQDALEETLRRVQRRHTVRRVMAGAIAFVVAVGAGVGLWNTFRHTTTKQVTSNRHPIVKAVRVPYPFWVAAGAGAVWLPWNDGSVRRIDPRSMKQTGSRLFCSMDTPPAF